jgi:hypothetical protein
MTWDRRFQAPKGPTIESDFSFAALGCGCDPSDIIVLCIAVHTRKEVELICFGGNGKLLSLQATRQDYLPPCFGAGEPLGGKGSAVVYLVNSCREAEQ